MITDSRPIWDASLAEILSQPATPGTRASATDIPGVNLEWMATGAYPAGAWFGDCGQPTLAQLYAMPTAYLAIGARASVLGVQYTYSAGAGWVRDTDLVKIQVALKQPIWPISPLSVTVTESTTKDAGATLQIAASQPSVSQTSDWNPASSRFAWFHAGKYGPLGVNSDSQFIVGKSVSYPTPSYNLLGMSFVLFGNDVSIMVAGKGGKVSVKVDDQYVTVIPLTIAADGNFHYIRLQLPGSGPYRVDVRGVNAPMGGVWISPTSSVMPAPRRGKKMLILGDSFTESAAETYSGLKGFCATISDLIGWDDVSPSGIGGTGYLADTSGTRKNLLQRIDDDCIALKPDVVVFAMGINDNGLNFASVIANAESCISRVKASGAEVIVCSPFWRSEVQTLSASLIAIDSELKNIASRNGCKWISVLEPVGTDAATLTTTLVESASTGATTIKTALHLPAGSSWKFPDGTRFHVKTTSNGSPRQTILNSEILTAQANGTVLTHCASSHWTGTGRTGAPAGYGTCDVLVGDGANDSTHPSTAGYQTLGYELARQIEHVYR